MKKIVLILISSLFIITACDEDFGDKNVNPNGASEMNPASMLSGAVMRFGTLTGRDYLAKPVLYVQYMSQVTYTDEMLYNEAPSSWYGYYVQTLSNLQTIINAAENVDNWPEEYTAYGARENQLGVAKIMKAVIFKQVTDAYGNIPFTEALNENISTPKYDSQEEIYKYLIECVKESRDMLDASKPGPTGDPIYLGDVTKWKKFANSFLLSLTLQLSKQYPGASDYAAQEYVKAAVNIGQNGAVLEVEDEAWFTYDPAHFYNNPWNAMRPTDYFLSKEFTDALHGYGADTTLNPTSNTTPDARMYIYMDDPAADGVPYGYENGSGAGAASMSSLIWGTDPPLPLMTSAYTLLNIAEGMALGWIDETMTGYPIEDVLYGAIAKSYASLSIHYGYDINASAPAYALARQNDMTTYGAEQVIAEEKWLALFPKGFEAWSEWRRSGYPDLKPATDYQNNGQIPRRLVYPSEEAGLNPEGYASGIQGLSPQSDNNTSKVWWDQ
ncbi:MAG: SusD/RagB family nutrient-binding outer membrane lipoprotein [Chlorobi bacterium]|nr:SusD/RagB family nutrient-binding outer membrane lipoprotein [Chlorobiota bacterium]